jgi:DNA (cytosine-5)-methyltransferase 1
MDELTVGSLFSGVAGFDLGFERAGMRTLWFCEQDEFCRRVLARHWPGVPCYPDVRALVADAAGVRRNGREPLPPTRPRHSQQLGDPCASHDEGRVVPVPVPHVDVLAGGFPCQDLSYAGKGAGIEGARSGLWSEFARLIGDLRPRYVVVENVPALLGRGLGRVLGDLAALGFDAEWDCLPASAFGAPHRRDRLWLVAYPDSHDAGRSILAEHDSGPIIVEGSSPGGHAHRLRDEVADAEGKPVGTGLRGQPASAWASVGWATEPDVGRVAHGIPDRVDRLRALGNALVPQIAEWIGERIVTFEREREADASRGA